MSGENTIKLDYPVTVGSETVDSITLSRPKVKDLKTLDDVVGDIAKAEALIIRSEGDGPVVAGTRVSILSLTEF